MRNAFRAVLASLLLATTPVSATPPSSLCATSPSACLALMGTLNGSTFSYQGNGSALTASVNGTTQTLALWLARITVNRINSGSGAPASSVGIDGDFYLDLTNSNFYGPKASGAWPSTYTPLAGPQGPPGVAAAGALAPGSGIVINNATISVDHGKVPLLYTGTFTGDGTTSTFVLTHNLGTTLVDVTVRDITNSQVYVANRSTTTTITIQWDVPPAAGAIYTVTILG